MVRFISRMPTAARLRCTRFGLTPKATFGVLRCLDAKTGEKLYEPRLSPDARIYAFVVKAGSKFALLARNQMGEPCFATPAILKSTLYFRTSESLVEVG